MDSKINKSDVYCIIVTFNAMTWIENCLKTVLLSSSHLNLIIIDNCSTDDTVNFIKSKYPEVDLIVNTENLGFGGANNKGVRKAIYEGAKYVFLLNQDTLIYPETVGNTLKIFERHERIGVVSPFHLNDDGTSLDYNFEIHLKYCKDRYISDVTLNKLKLYYEVEFTNAAAWMIKTDVIKEIGLFSDEFFHYGEDVNFIHRLHYFNYKCVVVPSVFIHHCREDRKGKFNYDFEKKRLLINTQIELLNINQSYVKSYFNVLKIMINELANTRIKMACVISRYSIVSFFKFKKARSKFLDKYIF